MARDEKLIINHLMTNNLATRWSCDWRTLNAVKDAIKSHNENVDALKKGNVPEFEVVQSAVTIATTLNSLCDAECHNPLLKPPLFIGPHQGGTLVNIHFEDRKRDEITQWLDKLKSEILSDSTKDADVLDDRAPVKNGDIAVSDNKFEFQGLTSWQGHPVLSVKFASEDDAKNFNDTWHVT